MTPGGRAAPAQGASLLDALGLPQAWAGQAQWRVLQVGGEGTAGVFLCAWRAWKDDPQRPQRLHFVAVDNRGWNGPRLHEAASAHAGLAPLAQALDAACFGLLPGFHRLAFEQGRVLLTLCMGDARAILRELDFNADSVLLAGAEATDRHRLKAIARLCRRGTRLAAPAATAPLASDLRPCGFAPEVVAGSEEEAAAAWAGRAIYAPAWEDSRRAPRADPRPGRCAVVGGGLAGAAVAASLARRGWQVQVLDAAPEPASGASSLPAGLLVAHQSPDDSLLSRLTRAGVRMTLAEAQALLRAGEDWALTGVLAHRPDAQSALPLQPPPDLAPWACAASAGRKGQAGLGAASPALWHERAGWIKPAALVRAWLAQPGIEWRGGTRVATITRVGVGVGEHGASPAPAADATGIRGHRPPPPRPGPWRLRDAAGTDLARVDLVVVAAAHASAALLPGALPLQPVRGQVSWSTAALPGPLAPLAVNGQGHFVAGVPLAGGSAWLCGASFDRDDTDLSVRAQDQAANLARLAELLPGVAAQAAPLFASGQVRAWTGVRCASADRRPLVGELAPNLWVSTAMGSRGLSFAHLCAELIAARLHGEPLPLPRKLAEALDAQRSRSNSPP